MLAAALAVVVLATPSPSSTPRPLRAEKTERDAFIREIRLKLARKEFRALEAMAAELARSDPRFPCGTSKLVDFHHALRPDDGPSDTPEAREASFRAWMAASPESYLPKLGLSLVALMQAGDARGGRPSREVSDPQWREYNRHMEVATTWAAAADRHQPADPHVYQHLILLCRGTDCPRSTAEKWLARALAINPRYDSAYVGMANYLLPHWHGQPGDMARLAERAAASDHELGEIGYVRVATVALLTAWNRLPEVHPGLSWQRIRAGLRQMDSRYPDCPRPRHLMARFAVAYKDPPAIVEAMSRVGEWNEDAAQYWESETYFRTIADWARRNARVR